MPFHIAIDGPVAAGKGTVSRLAAERLGFLYVDTGAMYRVTALIAHRQSLSLENEQLLVAAIEKSVIEMRNPTESERDGRLSTIILDGEDVSWAIRTEEISHDASVVAQLPLVRQALVKKQQEIAQNQDVVMEGRDITYRVLPDAQLKIYLTASDVVRAKRRHFQLQARGQDASFDEVYKELYERDQRDMSRTTDPLKIVPEAWVVDTSDLSIDNVVEMIAARANVMRQQPTTTVA